MVKRFYSNAETRARKWLILIPVPGPLKTSTRAVDPDHGKPAPEKHGRRKTWTLKSIE